jgi:hypothetical protein
LEIEVPYYDHNNIVKYSFQSLREFDKKTETGFLINHKTGKKYNLFEKPLEETNALKYKTEIERMDRADLTKVERCIKKLENETK